MNLIRCKKDDSDRITNFYRYVTQHTPGMVQNGRWIYGQHPTDEMKDVEVCVVHLLCVNPDMQRSGIAKAWKENKGYSAEWKEFSEIRL